MEPVITFFNELAQASISCSQAILKGGGLNFLLHLYLADFSDPLAVDMFHGRPPPQANPPSSM